MAIYTVELDGEQFDIEGPDDATEDELRNAAISAKAPPEESTARKNTRRVAKALPFVGGAVGSLAGPVIGTGIGTAAGAAVREAILSSLGDQAPSLGEVTGRVVGEGALGALAGGALKGVAAGGRFVRGAFRPGAAEARVAGREAAQAASRAGGEELAALRATAEAKKKALIEAERKAGLHFETSPGFEEAVANPKVAARTIENVRGLAKRGEEKLADATQPEQIQSIRKFFQEAKKKGALSDIADAEMRDLEGFLVRTLGKQRPDVVQPLGELAAAEKAVSAFPGILRERIKTLGTQTARNVAEGQKNERRRRILKTLATGVAAGAGLGALIR